MEEIEFKLLPENCPHKWLCYSGVIMERRICEYCGKQEIYPPKK